MNRIVSYIKSSFNEIIHNVAWPTMSNLQESAVLVVVGSLVFGLLIFGMDTVYGWLSSAVYK
jgi:preprotein translocase subunit SecE